MPIAPGTYWDLLERNNDIPTKRRAKHSKARTGCLTCKRRRVKCDESKPSCARCAKSGHGCAGYETANTDAVAENEASIGVTAASGALSAQSSQDSAKRSKGSVGAKHAVLRPKPPCKSYATANTSGDVAAGIGRGMDVLMRDSATEGPRRINLLHASLTPTYLEARDVSYFERFQHQILVDLGKWCGAEFWRHKILREVLRDKTVQHAALAGAAMLMDIEEQQKRAYNKQRRRITPSPPVEDGGMQVETPPAKEIGIGISSTSVHGRAALQHYTTAIGLCRQSLTAEEGPIMTSSPSSSTARSCLTATFFFAIFELVQGNALEADRLIASGESLLQEVFFSQQRCDNSNGGGTALFLLDDELNEIQLAFERMSVTWGLCPYFRQQKSKAQKGTTRSGSSSSCDSNEPDSSLGLDPVLGPRNRTTKHFKLPAPDASVRTKQVFWNAFSSEFGHFMSRMMTIIEDHTTTTAQSVTPLMLLQREEYLAQLSSWLPLLSDLSAQNPSSSVLCTTKAYAQTAIIFLNCFLDDSDMAYDTYLPIFQEIVAGYERQQQHRHHLPDEIATEPEHLRLTLDVDVFPIAAFTISKCRDFATRKRALRVFSSVTRRQALWTNSGMLAALQALVDLEEDESRLHRNDDDAYGDSSSSSSSSSTNFIPPSARYRHVGSEWEWEWESEPDSENRCRRMVAVVFRPVLSSGDDGTARRVPINY
jgi:hypothetical protein